MEEFSRRGDGEWDKDYEWEEQSLLKKQQDTFSSMTGRKDKEINKGKKEESGLHECPTF